MHWILLYEQNFYWNSYEKSLRVFEGQQVANLYSLLIIQLEKQFKKVGIKNYRIVIETLVYKEIYQSVIGG